MSEVKVTVASLQKEIEELTNKLESKNKLSASDKQVAIDRIGELKREIEKLTKEEKKITPVVNAPTIGERKDTRRSMFLGSNKIIL